MRARRPGLVAIVAYDQLRTFEYAIAAEVFALPRPTLGVRWYETIVVTPDRGRLRGIGGVEVRPTAPFERIDEARTVVVPGWRDLDRPPPRKLIEAVRAAARRKARIVSLCSGAFVLGHAGLLDGRRATTHWLFAEAFRGQFPAARYDDDVLYVDERDIVTSAGSAAAIDACLHIVRNDYGARVANMVARRMVVAAHREGGQAQFVEAPLAPRPERGVGPALEWASRRLGEPMVIATLAARVAMSTRTFFRRCQEQTGMSPNQWMKRERIARARSLLETESLSLAEISRECGYDSPETFRVAFKQVAGVAPGQYRRRFRLGRRAR